MTNKHIIGGLTLILILLSVGAYLSIRQRNAQIATLQLSLSQATSLTNLANQKVYQQDVLLSSSQKEIRSLTDSLFNMGKKHDKQISTIHAFYRGKTSVTIRDREIPYLDTVTMKKWSDSISLQCKEVIDYLNDSTVKVGTIVNDSTPHYSFSATINKKSLTINHISFIDTQSVRFITIKGGPLKRDGGKLRLWKKKTIKAQVTHTNPYFINNGVDAILYQQPPNHAFIKGVGVGGIVVAILTLL